MQAYRDGFTEKIALAWKRCRRQRLQMFFRDAEGEDDNENAWKPQTWYRLQLACKRSHRPGYAGSDLTSVTGNNEEFPQSRSVDQAMKNNRLLEALRKLL